MAKTKSVYDPVETSDDPFCDRYLPKELIEGVEQITAL